MTAPAKPTIDKRITETAEEPEPVAWCRKDATSYIDFCPASAKHFESSACYTEPLYGHDLLAAYHRMKAERDELLWHKDDARVQKNRAKTAERQLAELREKHDGLVKRLREPDTEMIEAARGHMTTHDIFTAMSAVALRREGE